MSEGREEGGGEERREEGSEAEGKVRKVGKGGEERERKARGEEEVTGSKIEWR